MQKPESGSDFQALRAQNEPALGGPPGRPSEEYAKSSPPPSSQGKSYDPRMVRAERYMLLAEARGLLYTEGLRQKLLYANQIHATTKCRYITRGGDLRVMQSKEHGNAFYADLVTCGSVWSCPVCSALIQERRRVELEHAINWAYENDLQPVMVTLTSPHKSWHTMKELLIQQAEALGCLRKGAAYDRFKTRIGYEGMIRGLETKYGENGWHNHTHELMFVSKGAIADSRDKSALEIEAKVRGCSAEDLQGLPDIKSEILKRWETACRKVGLLDDSKVAAFREHAVDVKGWCSASDYLAKQDDARNWGIDREMAKANNKTSTGGRKGLHPFGLLANAAEGDQQAGYRFVEYSLAIRGRAQLFWSRGLKAKVGITDKSDEELAIEDQDKASCLGRLEQADWAVIRAAPGAMAKLLDIAQDGGWSAVRAYVDGLKTQADRYSTAYSELRAKAKLLAEAKEGEEARPPIAVKLGRGRRTPALIEHVRPPKRIDLDQGTLELPF